MNLNTTSSQWLHTVAFPLGRKWALSTGKAQWVHIFSGWLIMHHSDEGCLSCVLLGVYTVYTVYALYSMLSRNVCTCWVQGRAGWFGGKYNYVFVFRSLWWLWFKKKKITTGLMCLFVDMHSSTFGQNGFDNNCEYNY